MHFSKSQKTSSVWLTALLSLALAALGYLHFGGYGTKWMTLAAGIAILFLLLRGDLKRLWNAPTLLLLGYVVFSWLTAFWAMSGKFHLREWSKILIATAFFLFLLLRKRQDAGITRQVMRVISLISAFFAVLSIAAAAYEPLCALIHSLPGLSGLHIAFDGSRLYGIFGNSNVEASLYAAGILLSIGVVCGAEEKWERILFTCTLSVSALAFLLAFSMGAMVCFAAAIIVYLIFAGASRGAALLRMLGAALPTLVCAFAAFRLYTDKQGTAVIALMLANAAISVVLELTINARLSAMLEKHGKEVLWLTLGVLAAAAVYAIAALNVTGAYTFGTPINRSAQLPAGEHELVVEADGAVTLRIYAQSRVQMTTGGATTLYSAPVEGAITFTVPEDDSVTFFAFSAEEGVTVSCAVIDGASELPLGYKLLPGFAAYRIQYLGMSTSALQRALFREDAIKLFALSPVVGNGVGAFESGVRRVQDFPYETRYVHNHYLQVLLEDGVIGFALYAGALLMMLYALLKKRREMQESEYGRLYPALFSAFVMNGGQMLWDVSMSMVIFLCMTYAVYALIVAACAEPLGAKKAVAAAGEKKSKAAKQTRKSGQRSGLARGIGAGITAIIVLTLCLNLYADGRSSAPVSDVSDFFDNLQTAARVDLYEKNDRKLSYLVNAQNEGLDNYRAQTDKYAAELAKVQSNTIPRYLVRYYLQTGQYGLAIDAALLSATYSASDAETWNANASVLKTALFDSDAFSPLLTDSETLLPQLVHYRDVLLAHNEAALVPVTLDETAQAFFDKIAALDDCADDTRLFLETLLTREG